MQKVIMYKSDNGELFATKEEAKLYDIGEQYRTWYECNRVKGSNQEDCPPIYWDDFLKWLLDNFDVMTELIKSLENKD
jgi:hypothetical protein